MDISELKGFHLHEVKPPDLPTRGSAPRPPLRAPPQTPVHFKREINSVVLYMSTVP